MKKTTLRIVRSCLLLCIVFALMMTMIAGCGKEKKEDKKDTADNNNATVLTDCTVTVKAENGTALENIGVSVYKDKEQKDFVYFARTNAEGVAAINSDVSSGSYVFLTDVPAIYTAETSYTISEKDMTITLKINPSAGVMLGCEMFDFTVTDQNGEEQTLSTLLESKKAVLINLWYVDCDPCKMEFPYLQQAYNEYSEDVALVALSPYDTADAIAAFATEYNLTFPMAAADFEWTKNETVTAYPTSIMVDRFGKVALIHTGAVDNSKVLKNLFAHFAADEYEHATYSDLSAFVGGEDEYPLGSEENPHEHSGSDSINLALEPEQTVYYALYALNGFELTAYGDGLKITYGEKVYTAKEEGVSFTLKAADAHTPILIQFTNTAKEAGTYEVSFTAPAGAQDNPIALKNGSVTIKLEADNNKGVYYLYQAAEDGTVTVECKNTVSYTVTVTNLSNNKTTTLDKSNKSAAIDVRKNDKLQVMVIAVAKDGKYPATEAKLSVSFKEYEEPVVPPQIEDPVDPPVYNYDGTLSNPDAPIDIFTLDFTAEVKAGEKVLYHLYRLTGTTLRIADPSAYIVYEGTTYKPDANGYVSIPVTCPSTYEPAVVEIGNAGNTDKSYAARLSFPEGHLMNPIEVTAGDFTANIPANSEEGVYLIFTCEQAGSVTITLKSVSDGAGCEFRVTNLRSSMQVVLSESEDGKTVTLARVRPGDEIQININTIPNDQYSYPAATVVATIANA